MGWLLTTCAYKRANASSLQRKKEQPIQNRISEVLPGDPDPGCSGGCGGGGGDGRGGWLIDWLAVRQRGRVIIEAFSRF